MCCLAGCICVFGGKLIKCRDGSVAYSAIRYGGWNRYNTRKRIQLTRCKVLQHSSRVRSLIAEDPVTVGVVAAALLDLVNCCSRVRMASDRHHHRRRRHQMSLASSRVCVADVRDPREMWWLFRSSSSPAIVR